MQERILIVEDESKIARVLELELRHEGYSVTVAEDGRTGLELALRGEWELVLLDIMLPEISGLEVLRRVRHSHPQLPVILITARDSVPDKVSGLDIGANDYVTKPFAIEELLARIRNLLRLTMKHAERTSYTVGDLTVNTKTRRVTRQDRSVELTPREYDLLVYLMQHVGSVLTREQIMSDVWGYDFVGDTNVVDVYIRYLRQKIDKGFKPKLIHTCHGVGYEMRDPAS